MILTRQNLYLHSLLKRCLDIMVALLVIMLTSPVFLLTLLLSFIVHGSHLFFRQQRAGLNGEIFTVWKFRTMVQGVDDHQISLFGNFIRRWGLDELPQLWSVLVGKMSMVGPRPLLPHYTSKFDDFQKLRLLARPGLTGLVQINGGNRLSWESRFQLDVAYIQKASFSLDLKILILTPWTMLRNRDAQPSPPFVD